MLLCSAFVTYFAWPSFANYIRTASDVPDAEQVQNTVTKLKVSSKFGDKLAAAALNRTLLDVRYDDSLYNDLSYPNGDIPSDRGNNADLVIRTYREMNLDLQQLVHEDMRDNFYVYPKLWGLRKANSNIDHRRVNNLQRFFERKGKVIEVSSETDGYANGDVVIWRTPTGSSHIGIIVPGPGSLYDQPWVVHNNSQSIEGARWNDELFDHTIIAHIRYHGNP